MQCTRLERRIRLFCFLKYDVTAPKCHVTDSFGANLKSMNESFDFLYKIRLFWKDD